MNPITITVIGDNAPMSPNKMRGMNRYRLMKLQDAAKRRAFAAWVIAGKPVLAGPWPVRVDVVIRRGRTMDRDNAYGSLKAVIDGLFKLRVTPDDSERFLDLRTPVQETGKRWVGREEVVFTIWKDEG